MKKQNILIVIVAVTIIVTATLPFIFGDNAKKTNKTIKKEKQIFQTELKLD